MIKLKYVVTVTHITIILNINNVSESKLNLQ